MCERCVELDCKIAHYRELSSKVIDKEALDGIARLIGKYEADKKDLHPEPRGEGPA